MNFTNLAITASAILSVIQIGGSLYEVIVVDPCWPSRPDLIQPTRGGINRKRFWVPAHIAFELTLITALISAWNLPHVRFWLLTALASHAAMRLWSALDFIPKALAFEKAATVNEQSAHSWTRRSRLRLPLDFVTAFSLLATIAAVFRR